MVHQISKKAATALDRAIETLLDDNDLASIIATDGLIVIAGLVMYGYPISLDRRLRLEEQLKRRGFKQIVQELLKI